MRIIPLIQMLLLMAISVLSFPGNARGTADGEILHKCETSVVALAEKATRKGEVVAIRKQSPMESFEVGGKIIEKPEPARSIIKVDNETWQCKFDVQFVSKTSERTEVWKATVSPYETVAVRIVP